MGAWVLAVLCIPWLLGLRRVVRLRQMGRARTGRRLYRALARSVTALALTAMLGQEVLLVLASQWTLATGLPLHLCAVLGLLIGPMLTLRSRTLWHGSLYLGIPCGLLALAFPALLSSPWPWAAAACFLTLHACLVLAPLLPLALGLRPEPRGAAESFCLLAAYAGPVAVVNRLLDTDYLFLSAPALDTPLMALARHGRAGYLLGLIVLAAVVLAAEGLCVRWLLARRARTSARAERGA